MKKLSINKIELLRWLVAGFLFSMSGVLMQIIAPAVPDIATAMGIVFFALMLVFVAMISKLCKAIRKERAVAVHKEVLHERRQQDD